MFTLLARDEVVFTDADEARNRIKIGILPGADEIPIVNAILERGVPREAVLITHRERAVIANDLGSRVRSTAGGLRIRSALAGCTLGFNLKSGSSMHFMTNSHCTDSMFETTGALFYQPTWGQAADRLGVEVWDPAPFGPEDNIACDSLICRWSDAALIAYDNGVQAGRGLIAKTSYGGQWTGSTTIAGHFRVVGKHQFINGDTVHKVGATTGWTYGEVDDVCYNERHPINPGVMLLCQYTAKAGSQPGDSGSPVFVQYAGNDVGLAGILWGSRTTGDIVTHFIFSPIDGIQKDFNITLDVEAAPPLSTYIAGSSQVKPYENCIWQGIPNGGESPYTYAWSGVLSKSGPQNWVSGVVSHSGWLDLLVTSSDGQQAMDSYYIEVTPSASGCIQ